MMKNCQALLLGMASLTMGVPAIAQPEVRVVARGGDAAPGGGTFSGGGGFNKHAINDAGEVVFEGAIVGVPSGLFLETGGTLQEIVRVGDLVPGDSTRYFDRFGFLGANDGANLTISLPGTVAFEALTEDVSTGAFNRNGYWLGTPSGLTRIFEFGDAAPFIGMTATLEDKLDRSIAISPTGEAVIRSGYRLTSTSSIRDVILRYDGTLSAEAFEGGTLPGAFSTYEVLRPPYINPSNEIFFNFTKDDGGSVDQIYFDGLDVEQGDPVPGFSGHIFTDFANEINVSSDAGFAFVAGVACPMCPSGIPVFDRGLFRYLGGVGELVAAEGSVAPGTGGLQTFANLLNIPGGLRMNGDGDVAFLTELSSGTFGPFGIWKKGATGSLDKVAILGDPAPGITSNTFGTLLPPAIVSDGQVLFEAITNFGFAGVWATDSIGAILNVVNDSGTVDLGTPCSSDEYDVDGVSGTYLGEERGTQQGRTNNFNNNGEIVLVIDFKVGTATETAVMVFDTRPCRADLDGDGELTIFDFLAFQSAFDAMDPIADWDCDGMYTVFDGIEYNNDFDAGCDDW